MITILVFSLVAIAVAFAAVPAVTFALMLETCARRVALTGGLAASLSESGIRIRPLGGSAANDAWSSVA
jgi:hypothetical protein